MEIAGLIRDHRYISGMRLDFGKNSGKFYVAIDYSPIQHNRF